MGPSTGCALPRGLRGMRNRGSGHGRRPRCSLGSVPVLIEQGITSSASIDCGTFATILGEYQGTFVDSWGAVALEEEQWTLRVRAGAVADSAGHTGVTLPPLQGRRHRRGRAGDLPSRAPPRAAGRGSDDHHGWCSNFAPWEERVLGVDENAYLGCAR